VYRYLPILITCDSLPDLVHLLCEYDEDITIQLNYMGIPEGSSFFGPYVQDDDIQIEDE
jgi:hypothetical protein